MKTIEINIFSEKSIENAMKEIDLYEMKLAACEDKILEKLAKYAKKQMQYWISHTTNTGDDHTADGTLLQSIQIEYSPHLARIFTDLFYAKYVEYGTGVVGSKNPHPELPEGWKYNSKEEGWVYEDKNGHFWHTKGEVAHQFVYKTYLDLRDNYVRLAKEVLKEEGLI